MSRYPKAQYRETVGLANDPVIHPVGVILHVSASEAPSLFGYFNGPSGGVESHLHIPYSSGYPIEQYRDTEREADANYRGNSWVDTGIRKGFLSVETQGRGDGEWTDYQVTEIIDFCRWASNEHDFPLVIPRHYRDTGVGYHVQFGAGAGLNAWSNARGKICPGGRRIAQYHDVILPALQGRVTVPAPPTSFRPSPVPSVPTLVAPPFPLRSGWYFGPKSGPRQSVSGYYDRLSNGRPGHDGLWNWQTRMHGRGWAVDVDGLYGSQTEDVASKFQREKSLAVDGLVGPSTFRAAWEAPTT